MRILMVSHTTNPWTSHFARFFRDRQDDLLVASFTAAPLEGLDGVDMEFIGVEPFERHKNEHVYITRIPLLRPVIRRFAPDVVFAPYLIPNGLTAALSFGGPTAVTAVGSGVMELRMRSTIT